METTKGTENTKASEGKSGEAGFREADCCALLRAAIEMDWKQVHLHHGEPCFDLMPDGRFCGRSKGWHETGYTHEFVSLYDLLWDVMTRPHEEVKIPEVNHAEAVAKILSHNAELRNRARKENDEQ